jgi:phosphomannomutase
MAPARRVALGPLAGTPVGVDTLDGTTVVADDGSWWFNLRPSNTEPFLRYNGEATTPETMAAVRDQVLEIVRGEA